MEASRVFWSCLRQLQLDRDVSCAKFHPDWQQEKQAWPTYVQQVLHVPRSSAAACHDLRP